MSTRLGDSDPPPHLATYPFGPLLRFWIRNGIGTPPGSRNWRRQALESAIFNTKYVSELNGDEGNDLSPSISKWQTGERFPTDGYWKALRIALTAGIPPKPRRAWDALLEAAWEHDKTLTPQQRRERYTAFDSSIGTPSPIATIAADQRRMEAQALDLEKTGNLNGLSESSATPSPNSEPKAEFWRLFDRHWNAGTGRAATPRRAVAEWSVKDFASALAIAGTATDEDTINKWLRHANLPRGPNHNAILTAFFAATPNHPDAAAMRHAWAEAKASPPRPRRPAAPASPHSPFRITDPLEVDGLVELKLHPTPGNTDQTFRLDATISFGILPYEHEGTTVEIALTDAEIAITSNAYQPVHRSRVCDRTDHAYLKPAPGGGISVIGPQRRGALHGDPLGTDHLAVMERLDDAEGPVTVVIRARSRTSIRTEAQDTAVTVNKQAIIDAILSEGERKDPMGRLVFARRRVTRRTPL
jgi:hypothetical protein